MDHVCLKKNIPIHDMATLGPLKVKLLVGYM